MTGRYSKGMEFTIAAEERFYDVVDDPLFHSEDRNLIFRALLSSLHPIMFGDFLKRYIHRKAGMTEDFDAVPLSEYQQIIVSNFADTQTPFSLGEGRVSPRMTAKNWLTQQTVSRRAVLLMGFGLRMTEEEVNEFLTKALHEHRLSPKDPEEVICRYCYRNRLDYARYEVLLEQSRRLDPAGLAGTLDGTRVLEGRVHGVRTDSELLRYLEGLALNARSARGSAAREHFNRLYARAQELTARFNNEMDEEDTDVEEARLRDKLDRDDRLWEAQKRERVAGLRESLRDMEARDITPADMEKVLCASIPLRKDGNYLPVKESLLYRQFEGKRFQRKHMHDLLQRKVPVTRFDLITMNFYCFAVEPDAEESVIRRYARFVKETNTILEESSMGSLYLANPYECFVLMCMLSDDPLGTYADVWELSYEEAGRDK